MTCTKWHVEQFHQQDIFHVHISFIMLTLRLREIETYLCGENIYIDLYIVLLNALNMLNKLPIAYLWTKKFNLISSILHTLLCNHENAMEH